MQEIIGACGNQCTSCPWSVYMRKVVSKDEWEEYSKNIKKYIGFTSTKYEWEGCMGCTVKDNEMPDHPHYNFLRNCRTRRCAKASGISTCAQCTSFACGDSVMTDTYSWKKQVEKHPDLTKEDYSDFIQQFDGLTHLHLLRTSLSRDDIKEPHIIKEKKTIQPFPSIYDQYQGPYHKLYLDLQQIIESDVFVDNPLTIAGRHQLDVKLDGILRLLWIVGLQGEMKSSSQITIDSITLNNLKKTSNLPINEKAWEELFATLQYVGIHGSLEFHTKEMSTPTGYMRYKIPKSGNPVYHVNLELSENLQQHDFIVLLQKYAQKLNTSYKRGAFNRFCELDMSKVIN